MSTSMQDIHPPWHSGWRVSADLKGTIPGLFVIPITNNMGQDPQNFVWLDPFKLSESVQAPGEHYHNGYVELQDQ